MQDESADFMKNQPPYEQSCDLGQIKQEYDQQDEKNEPQDLEFFLRLAKEVRVGKVVMCCSLVGFLICVLAIFTQIFELFGIGFGFLLATISLVPTFALPFKRKNVSTILVGFAGLLIIGGTVFYVFADSDMKETIEVFLPLLIPFVFVLFGGSILISRIATAIRLKRLCTQSVMAQCTEIMVSISSSRKNGKTTDAESYAPKFEFYYNGEYYTVVQNYSSSRCMFVKSENYEIMINPNCPTEFRYISEKAHAMVYFISTLFTVIGLGVGYVMLTQLL